MRKFVVLTVLTILTLITPIPVYADALSDGKIILGEDYTLQSGQEVNGDLLVLGGNVRLEEGSVVEGDILVLGGNVVCAGEVTGTLSAVGGNVQLEGTAIIQGDLATIGGNVTEAEGARIEGQQITGNTIDIPDGFELNMPLDSVDSIPNPRFQLTPVWDVMWYLFRSVIMAGLAALIVLFWPKPIRRTADAMIQQPILAGGVGLLTVLAAPIAIVLLAVTIILLPVSAVAIVLLVAAVTYGWIAMGLEVGERITAAADWDLHAAAAAALGTSILSLVVGGVNFIPCIGWIAPFIVMVLGLGAVLLTLFGSRTYQGRAVPVGGAASTAPQISEAMLAGKPESSSDTVGDQN